RKYVRVSVDREYLTEEGAELLIQTAGMSSVPGFFSSRQKGRFVINGVPGPVEYTTVIDNPAFTHLMARVNLQIAVECSDRPPRPQPDLYDRLVTATRLGMGELDLFRRAADAMYVPFDQEAQVHLQDDSFLDQEPWDFEAV